MFLINCLGFYASHPAACCNLASPICLFPAAASTSTLLSHPQAEQVLGAGGTRGKRNYKPEGETTHQQRSQYSVIRIISVGCAKIGAVPTTLQWIRKDFTRELALRLEECTEQTKGWLFCRGCNTMETSQCQQRTKGINKIGYLCNEQKV